MLACPAALIAAAPGKRFLYSARSHGSIRRLNLPRFLISCRKPDRLDPLQELKELAYWSILGFVKASGHRKNLVTAAFLQPQGLFCLCRSGSLSASGCAPHQKCQFDAQEFCPRTAALFPLYSDPLVSAISRVFPCNSPAKYIHIITIILFFRKKVGQKLVRESF